MPAMNTRLQTAFSGVLRHLGLALVFGMLLGALLLYRAQRAGRQALQESDVAFDQGQMSLSLTKASDAMRWYFPFAPHTGEAKARLLAIAEGAESSGDLRLALSAWSALRSAIHEAENPLLPADPLLGRSNQAIVRLLPRSSGLLSTAPDTVQLLQVYTAPERNEPVFYLARSLGMGLLLVGVWLLFLRQRERGFVLGLGCMASGLFAWVFAAIGA